MNDSTSIPAGYRADAQGRLVPETNIRPVDLLRDELVNRLCSHAQALSVLLSEAKAMYFSEVSAFVDLSLEEYGVARGGSKGNVTLTSYDGRRRILLAKADVIQFDERLQAAKALIDECLNEWANNARPELRTIVHDAFAVDQQQNIRVQQVLGLRRLEIDDDRWRRAMLAIGESIQIVRTKSYIRFQERIGESDQWRQIPLDIAAVPL